MPLRRTLGRVPAAEYRFRWRDGESNFVFLRSIVARCVITDYLLDDASRAQLVRGDVQHGREFRHEAEGCLAVHRENPEIAAAYPEPVVRELYECHRLRILKTHYGGWCRAPEARHSQDYVVAEKRC